MVGGTFGILSGCFFLTFTCFSNASQDVSSSIIFAVNWVCLSHLHQGLVPRRVGDVPRVREGAPQQHPVPALDGQRARQHRPPLTGCSAFIRNPPKVLMTSSKGADGVCTDLNAPFTSAPPCPSTTSALP